MWFWLWLGCKEPEPAPTVPFDRTETSDTQAVSPLVFAGGRAPRNVLMISIDTLRKDTLGFYGGTAETDFLDGLMASSVHLDDHIQCSSWTYASTSCTLMGAYHEDNGYMPKLSMVQEPMPIDTGFLAQWFAQEGFLTMIHSSNEWLSARWGNTSGYLIQANLGGDAVSATRQASELLRAELTAGGDRPWLLHLHFIEPHAAYDPPSAYLDGLEGLPPVPYDLSSRDVHYDVNGDDDYETLSPEMQDAVREHLIVRYEADVSWLDDKMETIVTQLDADGMLDDTLLVVWTDHGEAFWEHGHQTHAWQLYPQENDAVLFFWAKDLAPAAWSGPTTAIDLAPTLLDLYGMPMPASVRGVPLGHALDDRVRYASIDARAGVLQMVRRGDDALYYSWTTGAVERYDLAADPGATRDRFTLVDEVSLALWDEMAPYRAALAPLVTDDRVHPPGLP